MTAGSHRVAPDRGRGWEHPRGHARPAQPISPKSTGPAGAPDALVQEWGRDDVAIRYLENAGFSLRADRSFAPPMDPKRRLNPKERRALEYLILEGGYVGLLTEPQHAEIQRQKAPDNHSPDASDDGPARAHR